MLIDLKSSQHLLTLWYSESISVVNIVNINDYYTYYVTEKNKALLIRAVTPSSSLSSSSFIDF